MVSQNVLLRGIRFMKYGIRSVYKRLNYQKMDDQAKKKGVFVYDHPLGFKMKLNAARVVDREIFTGFFETDTLKYFTNLVKPGMVFFDVGANIGLFSLVAKAKHADITVHAFEPADEVFDDFTENITLNGFSGINLHKKGISDATGPITFNICEDNAYNSIHDNPMVQIVKTVTIDTVSIDDFCEKNDISRIDIMKVDTEGAEFLVLKGGSRIFSAQNAPVLFMEYNRYILEPEQLKEITERLYGYGYEVYELWKGNIRKFNAERSRSYDLICMKPQHLAK